MAHIGRDRGRDNSVLDDSYHFVQSEQPLLSKRLSLALMVATERPPLLLTQSASDTPAVWTCGVRSSQPIGLEPVQDLAEGPVRHL